DLPETAQRAARTLVRTLDGEVKPVIVWGIRPMLTSTLEHTPSRQPMKDVMDMAIDAEKRGVVLNASVLGGFPQSDIPHLSCSAIIVCDGQTTQGQALLERMLDLAWRRRADFLYKGAPLVSQIAHARNPPISVCSHTLASIRAASATC